MPAPRFTPEELRQLRTLAAEWGKIVSRRAFGDDGPVSMWTSEPWSRSPPLPHKG